MVLLPQTQRLRQLVTRAAQRKELKIKQNELKLEQRDELRDVKIAAYEYALESMRRELEASVLVKQPRGPHRGMDERGRYHG